MKELLAWPSCPHMLLPHEYTCKTWTLSGWPEKAVLHTIFVSDQRWAKGLSAQVSSVAVRALTWCKWVFKPHSSKSHSGFSQHSSFYVCKIYQCTWARHRMMVKAEGSVTWQVAVRAREWWEPAATWTTSSPDKALIRRGWSLDGDTHRHADTDTHPHPLFSLTIYFDYCRCFWLAGRLKLFANSFSFAVRPGKLISMAELPLRAPTPAPHFCVKRRQPIIFLLLRCRLGLTTRGFQVCVSTLSPWRPWKKKTPS